MMQVASWGKGKQTTKYSKHTKFPFFRVFRVFRGSDDFQENLGEFGRGFFRLFLEAEEGGDFGGGFGEREREFAVVHLLLGGHEEIEIER